MRLRRFDEVFARARALMFSTPEEQELAERRFGARSRGLKAFTPEEFERSEYSVPQMFDSLLLSHVAEHMRLGEVVELLTKYRPLLKDAGRLILICPQECGFCL